MAFFSSMQTELIGVYDNEISVTRFTASANQVYGRDSLENVHHSGGAPQNHPTLTNVIKNTNGHVFLKGSYEFEWEWNPGDVTEAEVDAYIAEVTPTILYPALSFQKDMANNKLILTMPSTENRQYADWTPQAIEWHLKAPKGAIKSTSADCKFVCVTRMNNTYNDYTFDQITVEAGNSLEIVRPASTVCYVLFSHDVMKDGNTLTGEKLYKVTSASLNITNNQADRLRVLRYYK